MGCDSFGFKSPRVASNVGMPYPFLDYASLAVPRNWQQMFDWARAVRYSSPEFGMAVRRLYGYFITELQFASPDPDNDRLPPSEIAKWRDTFEQQLGYREHVLELGENIAFFGTDIVSVQDRFIRMLQCTADRCRKQYRLQDFARQSGTNFKYVDGNFTGVCKAKSCSLKGKTQKFKVRDYSLRRAKDVFIKHWPIHEISIEHHIAHDTYDVFWRIPEDYKQLIRSGHIETLAQANLSVLQAIKTNRLYQFERDRIFVGKERGWGCVHTDLKGWGMPRILPLSRQIWFLQALRRQNQVLATDYAVPIRMFTLAQQILPDGFRDPSQLISHSDFSMDIDAMVESHRQDPSRIYAVPYDVNYKLAGGEASQYAPVEQIDQALSDLYDGVGIPIDLFRGDFKLQGGPMGIRLFEATNRSIVSLNNRFLAFVSRRVSEILKWPLVEARHKKVQLADSIEAQAIKMQAAAQGQIPTGMALEDLDIGMEEANEGLIEEELMRLRAQRRLDEAMQKEELVNAAMMAAAPPEEAAAGGAGGGTQPPPGGAAPAGGGMPPGGVAAGMLPSTGFQIPRTLEERDGAAQAIAQQLVAIPNESARRKELSLLSTQDQQFYAVVKEYMRRFRDDAAAQGREAMIGY